MSSIKIDKNIPIEEDPRKGSKLTNPLYDTAKKMEIGDSVKFIYLEFPGLEKENCTLDELREHRQKTYDWENSRNAPNTLRRYLNDLYGKGSGAVRSLKNIPSENSDENGARVWRVK